MPAHVYGGRGEILYSLDYEFIIGAIMMIRKYNAVLISVLLLIVAFSGCTELNAGPEITEDFSSEYEVADTTILKVIGVNGNIEINSWDGDKVTLDAVKKTRYGEDELNKVEIVATQSRNELIIEAKFSPLNTRVSVDMNIKVPNNVSVKYVKTVSGNVHIYNTKGDTEALSTNGEVILKDVDGYVIAQTSNGNIDVRGTTGIGDLKTSNGAIFAEVFDIEEDVDITVTNGQITVYVNPSLNADIELKTTNGKISNEVSLNMTKIEEHLVEGTLGDGGNRLFISTVSGNLDLYKLDV